MSNMRFKNLICSILFFSSAYNILFAQKFEPEDGKCLVFVGQDLEAIGV